MLIKIIKSCNCLTVLSIGTCSCLSGISSLIFSLKFFRVLFSYYHWKLLPLSNAISKMLKSIRYSMWKLLKYYLYAFTLTTTFSFIFDFFWLDVFDCRSLLKSLFTSFYLEVCKRHFCLQRQIV